MKEIKLEYFAEKDSRALNAILHYGKAQNVSPAFRSIVLCDGDMGEGDAYRAACPKAKVAALPLSEALKALLAASFADKDALRNSYVQLKTQTFRDLYAFASSCRLTLPQAAFALRVLADIGLIEVSFSPFHAALLPPQKRSPEESRLFRLAQQVDLHFAL